LGTEAHFSIQPARLSIFCSRQKATPELPDASSTQGIEAMQMINKGRVRGLAKGDAVSQAYFIANVFGIAA
jgi:hypothetical protein